MAYSDTHEKGKHHAMKKPAVPLCFWDTLSQDKSAMQCFAHMSDRERAFVLSRAREARTRADMQIVVSSLPEYWNAAEEH